MNTIEFELHKVMTISLLNANNSKPIFSSVYRVILRNIKLNTFSLSFQQKLKEIIRRKIFAALQTKFETCKNKKVVLHKSLKSHVRELQQLNNVIVAHDTLYLKRFVMVNGLPHYKNYASSKNKPHNSHKQATQNAVEDPALTYEKKILNEFIRYEQYKSGSIPLPGKERIDPRALLPLATHRYYMNRLKYVEHFLSKPPRTSVKGTRSYFGRMWFPSNFLTNRRKQSRNLSMFLGLTRRSGEYHAALWKNLGNRTLDYTIMEAQWETELEKTLNSENVKTLEKKDNEIVLFSKYQNEAQKFLGNTKEPIFRWKRDNAYVSKFPILEEWLQPLLLNYEIVYGKTMIRTENLTRFRVETLPKIFERRHSLAIKVYNKSIAKWNKMCAEDLPSCNPFDPKNDLKSVLLKYGFLKKKPKKAYIT